MKSMLVTQETILKNKMQLKEYLSDFSPDRASDITSLFTEDDFKCGYYVFRGLMKSKIGMPKIGKSSLNYWISRGWSKEESTNKRIKVKLDPKKSPININFWINKGFTEEESKIKIRSQRKMNKEYWMCRGLSEEESISKSLRFQKESNNLFCKKWQCDDENWKNNLKKKMSNCVEYWIENGHSIEDAKIKLSERQKTFSLETCVYKYGSKLGEEIWKNRQNKWMESLSKSSYDGIKGKDAKSIIKFKEKYGDMWVDKFIEKTSFKNKDLIKSILLYTSYQDLIDNLLLENYKIHDIYLKLSNKLVATFYNASFEDMYKYLLEKSGYKGDNSSINFFKEKYGNMWVNKFIEKNTFKDKDEFRSLVLYNSYQDLIDNLIDKFSVTEISLKIKSALISNVYNTTFDEMFNYLITRPLIIKGSFGNMRYFNGHLCRSDGEFSIAKFLVDRKVEYEYEKNYPNSKKRYDFYLKDYDIYVEYLGMISVQRLSKKYLANYEDKKLFCEKNNLKHIFSSDINEIKKLIENEIKTNNRPIKQIAG